MAGETADVTVTWVGLRAETPDSYLLRAKDRASVTLTKVDLSDGGVGTVGIIGGAVSPSIDTSGIAAEIVVEFARINGEVTISGGTKITVARSVIKGSTEFVAYCWDLDPCDELTVANNLVLGPAFSVWGWVWAATRGGPYPAFVIEHNTFVGLETLSVEPTEWADTASEVVGSGEFSNNVLVRINELAINHSVELGYDLTMLDPDGCEGVDLAIALSDFGVNLHHEIGNAEAMGTYECLSWYRCDYADTDCGYIVSDATIVPREFLASSLGTDPLFAAGGYALDPTSPAVDAGSGDPDPDGSPPDIGAFGGLDGDWYRDYPWVVE